jgi:outer membrane receptor protein involved in Fe transport
MRRPRKVFSGLPRRMLALAAPGLLLAQSPREDKHLKDLLELMNTPVVSATRSEERLSDAPAAVIVLSRQDLESRGYTELSQILDDLPGMEVARSYGANYFKNYWRGYRNDIGDPFLVMVDGVAYNHLWFNTADTPLVSYPLSAVERVEVVYGPASAVYGTNAFMGVINLITRAGPGPEGFSFRGKLGGGSFQSRFADLQARVRSGGLTIALAARSDRGDMDESAAEGYEYTRRRYYADPRLWGSVVDDADRAGAARSEHRHGAVDLRVAYGATEFRFTRLVTDSGYGTAYAADASQSLGRWIRPETSFHVKQDLPLGERVTSTLLVRYRRSDVDQDSSDLESFHGYGTGASTVHTRYEVLNQSLSLAHDFEMRAGRRLALNAGYRFEQKTLQKAYATTSDGTAPGASLDDENHFSTTDRGAYLQARFEIDPAQRLFAGLRSDRNSAYGTANTLRGGYVGMFGAWGLKALFGQAYQEPTARLLFGATSGTGSNTGLRPETSNTAEVSGSYTRRDLNLTLGFHQVRNHGRIQKVGGQVVNSGDQVIRGMDLGLQWLPPSRGSLHGKVWAFYSHYFSARDIELHPEGTVEHRSGDLADHKFWGGATLNWSDRYTATLLARTVGPRPTVLSNPAGEVPGFTTVDLALEARNLGKRGIGLSLRVTNLADRRTFHPGLRDAGAGFTPGAFDTAGRWTGSTSYYSSLLPQPGRAVQVSLSLSY